jgi:hypothetical protein
MPAAVIAVAPVVTVPTVVIGAITTVITWAVIAAVVIRRVVTGIVIRCLVDVGRTVVVVAARQSKTEHCTEQQSTQHDGLREDL